MTVLHSGSNNKYSGNWAQAFGKAPAGAAKSTKKKAPTKAAASKTTKKK